MGPSHLFVLESIPDQRSSQNGGHRCRPLRPNALPSCSKCSTLTEAESACVCSGSVPIERSWRDLNCPGDNARPRGTCLPRPGDEIHCRIDDLLTQLPAPPQGQALSRWGQPSFLSRLRAAHVRDRRPPGASVVGPADQHRQVIVAAIRIEEWFVVVSRRGWMA